MGILGRGRAVAAGGGQRDPVVPEPFMGPRQQQIREPAPAGAGGVFAPLFNPLRGLFKNMFGASLTPNSVINNNQRFVFQGQGGLPPDQVFDAFNVQKREEFLRNGRVG